MSGLLIGDGLFGWDVMGGDAETVGLQLGLGLFGLDVFGGGVYVPPPPPPLFSGTNVPMVGFIPG